MHLYLVRHGETEWNDQGRVLGRTDIPLNEKGRKQAEEIALKAQELPIDVILASPLKRAQETARAISERIHIPIITVPDLIESDFGIYEGVDRNDPAYQESKRRFFTRKPQGESFLDVAGRIHPLLKKIREQYAGKNVMLVTHGGIGRIVDTYFYDKGNEEFISFFMENCEIREYEMD